MYNFFYNNLGVQRVIAYFYDSSKRFGKDCLDLTKNA